MNIKIYGIIKYLPVQTISLGKNIDPETTYLFHCFYCGQSICQIQGKVDKLFPGLEPTSDVVVINKCPQCHKTYTFQTHNYKYDDITKVVLTNQEGLMTTFHCYVCRTPILQFKGTQIYTLPDFDSSSLPLKLKCHRADCGKKYFFIDVV